MTRHSTGHWAPPLCSWLEEQPNLPAPISREQAPALKLSKNRRCGKKKSFTEPVCEWWDVGLQVPRGEQPLWMGSLP